MSGDDRGLLPVTDVVVRRGDTSDHKTLVTALILALGDFVHNKLMIHSVKDGLPRHLSLEQRHIHTGDLLHDSVHLDLRHSGDSLTLRGERNLVDLVDIEISPAAEQGILDGDLVLDREHEFLVTFLIELVKALVGDSLMRLLHVIGVSHGEGVILEPTCMRTTISPLL